MAITTGQGLALGAGANLLGSGLNYLSGVSAAANAHKANNNAQEALATTAGYADNAYTQGQAVLQQMLAANQGIYGTPEQAAANLQAAQSAVNGVNPYEAGSFKYNKSVDDFYDNALGLRMNAAGDAINQSQALGGSLFSSDTANKLTAQAQVLGSEAYKDALSAYQADKSLEQGIWQGNESAQQAAANSAMQAAQAKYNMAADNAGNLSDANNAYYQSLLGLNGDYWKNKSDFAANMAGLMAQDQGGNWLTWLLS